MKERSIAKKITHHLNHGTHQLDGSILKRLQAARQQALEAQVKPRHAMGLAWSGSVGAGHGEERHFSPRLWLSLALLLAGMLITFNWQSMNHEDPMAGDDVDATLLAGDLPVRAYLDNDFDSWLEQSSRR